MRARGESALKLMLTINKAGTMDWRAAAWILERRFPKDFGKQLVEVTGEDGAPMRVEIATLRNMVLQALKDDPDAKVKVANAFVEADADARAS